VSELAQVIIAAACGTAVVLVAIGLGRRRGPQQPEGPVVTTVCPVCGGAIPEGCTCGQRRG